jgi:hypothetical protein
MPKKRTESVLGLPALSPQSAFEATMNLALVGDHRALTKREKDIFTTLHEQEVVMDAVGSKAIFGLEKMNEVKRAAATDTLYTLQFLEETKEEAHLTQYQGAFDEFSTRLATLSCRHSLGAVEVSATLIAAEISRTLYPPDEEPEEKPKPEPPKPFLLRLLGG